MMTKDNSRTPIVILAVFALLLLFGVLITGGYVMGRQSAAGPEPQDSVAEAAISEAASAEVSSADKAAAELAEAVAIAAATSAAPATVAADPVEAAAESDATESDAPIVQQATPIAPPETPEAASSGAEETLPGDFDQEDLAILWEVWQIIENEFDGEMPADEELAYAVVRGILKELQDPFTRFAEPDVAERTREDLQGSFEGIGAIVRENDEGLTEIVRPFDGQPADQAGLQAGDVVLAIDGDSMIGKSLEEVISLIRGPRGTQVTITFGREGLDEPFDATITRDRIEIPIVASEMLEEGIGYVHLTSFNSNAVDQLSAAVSELLAQNPSGLILDLRDNPGGFLDQSVSVADLFLPEGVVLFERSAVYDIDQTYRSVTGDMAETIPLVVLINAGSASASEIVAGAIQDNGRGILIGEVSFGKGSVQQPHYLSDGSELRVTIARWYTPNNRSINGDGITPDIEVETPEDLGGEDDTQLQRAIEYLLTGE